MLDEYGIVDIITRRSRRLPGGYLQIGDDVAMIPAGRAGHGVVLKCDMLVGMTDVPPGMTWRRASRKAVAMCVSDFAAKGVRPTAFMVSLGLPKRTAEKKVAELASGLFDGIREWDIKLVGGDTNEAGDLIIDCVMLGFAEKVVQRDGAKMGEYVVTTETFGQTMAGLRILMEGARADSRFKKLALSSVYLPTPKLDVGIALSGCLTSSIDSSDGLAMSLHIISEMSGVGIRVSEVPYASGLREFASINSYSVEDLALYGGEEYAIVGSVKKSRLQEARQRARSAGCELHVIGETVAAEKLRGVAFADGRKIRRDGWIHFHGGQRSTTRT